MEHPEHYTSKNINHLGLVAGMCDELGIVETIDRLIPQDQEQRKVSIGQAVKAMILNGLGFTNRALYLTPHFFQDKPVDRLLGSDITAEQLNDDTLGRALDKIYDYGPSKLFSHCAVQSVNRLGLQARYGHLDSTSLHVDGEYNSNDEEQDGVIRITNGYSRDHRPDLNQLVLQLICERQAGIPLLMETLSGNKTDKESFRDTIKAHIGQLKTDFGMEYLIADSALYVAETLREMNNIWWISRVPETINATKEAIDHVASDLMKNPAESASCTLGSVYADVKQRWVIVYSPQANKKAQKTVNKHMLETTTKELAAFETLCKREFSCEADAVKTLILFKKDLKASVVEEVQINVLPHFYNKGRPGKGDKPDFYTYQIKGALASQISHKNKMLQRKSCFIIATNQLDDKALTEEDLLDAYKKDQQKVERGFRFLKDPMFMASTMFLKSPERIMAVTMIMTLCLMVYAGLEHRIREALQRNESTFVDQKGKPTAKPTARWVFQYFSGIHVLIVGCMRQLVLNINDMHLVLLAILGERYQHIYADSGLE